MVVGACATTPKTLEEKVVGRYWYRAESESSYMVLCDEGLLPDAPNAVEFWKEGEKREVGLWSVKNGEIHVVLSGEGTGIFLLNADGNLKLIAVESEGKRKMMEPEILEKTK